MGSDHFAEAWSSIDDPVFNFSTQEEPGLLGGSFGVGDDAVFDYCY